MDKDLSFCSQILPKVSRTFSLNIRMLRGVSQRAVLTGYLICRIIDTVEDAPNISPVKKLDLLKEFHRLFNSKPVNLQELQAFSRAAEKCTIVFDESKLLQNSESVLKVFFRLPHQVQRLMAFPINKMLYGMTSFIARYRDHTFAQLRDIPELLTYCYYVAGTVGELVTGIFSRRIRENWRKGVLESRKIDFGIALQLTNILKDFSTDEKRGWSYIPADLFAKYKVSSRDFSTWRKTDRRVQITEELLKLTWQYLDRSLNYILAIPRRLYRERLFCAVAFFLSAKTLACLKSNLGKKSDSLKISRKEVKRTLRILPWIVFSDRRLIRYYQKLKNLR